MATDVEASVIWVRFYRLLYQPPKVAMLIDLWVVIWNEMELEKP